MLTSYISGHGRILCFFFVRIWFYFYGDTVVPKILEIIVWLNQFNWTWTQELMVIAVLSITSKQHQKQSDHC